MVKRRKRSRSGSSDRYISGKDGLKLIDQSVASHRAALDAAIRAADETVQRRGDVRKEQAQAYLELAEFRLDVLRETGDIGELTKAEARAEDLLEEHAEFVAGEHAALDGLAADIEALEADRKAAGLRLDEAVETQEDLINKLLADLSETSAYKDLHEALDNAAAVAERARQKLAVAQNDRQEKGRPYDDDPLFSYLWKRKFRTVDYKAGALTRTLDGWVGKLCGYDKAHLTYARLTELPERLAEHVTHVEALETETENTLKIMEARTLREGGVDDQEADIEKIRAAIRQIDVQVESAEEKHLTRSKSHQDAVEARTGPAEEAHKLLATALRKMNFPDLRIMVAQTVELEDDRIVDRLVKLRAEEIQLDLAISDRNRLPNRRSRDLKIAESLRKEYKRANYASHNLLLDRAVLEDVLSDLKSQVIDLRAGLKRVRKTIRRADDGRRRPYQSSRGRRSRRRQRDTAYGFEDVAGTVAWELAKVVIRGGGSVLGGDVDLDDFGDGGDRDDGGFKTGGRF